MTLKELGIGQSAIIETVGGTGALRQHFLDMGVIPGAEVTVLKYAPLGDPVEILIHGYSLTLRLDDAAKIGVKPINKHTPEEEKEVKHKKTPHPGLGEEGIYHPKGSGDPLPKGTVLTFALVGNQNSGKTTLFNALTGPGCYSGPQGWCDPRTRGYADHGSSGYLFHVSLLQRGTGVERFRTE